MPKNIAYPTEETVIEYNLLVLKLIRVKKADSPKVLSYRRITDVLKEAKNLEGDIYDKAVCLLKGLIQKHSFASGNRRTAFVVAKEFLLTNNAAFNVKDDPSQARVMQGIRENYYTSEEIKRWVKHGEIKEFKR